MAEQLENLLRACTVRVTGGPSPGAGFFVAPDQILTCVHVIGDSADLMVRWERDGQQMIEVPVSGRVAVLEDRGRPIPVLDRDYPDVAVLKVDGIDDHPCVGIDSDWPSLEDQFLVFGYPQEGGAIRLTPARLTYRGTHGTLPTSYLDLASDTIKPGMSGAAVLNLRSGKVCGVVVASKHPAHPDGALAIPWSAIEMDLAGVLSANRLFHQHDHRWEEATAYLRRRLQFRVPRVVAHFTGRDGLLAQLEAAFTRDRVGVITQAITGLGGVGKTQLAAAFVAAHHDEFDITAWVRAEDRGTADLAELAVALGLPVTGRTPPERANDALIYLANTERRWLLVLDNVQYPSALTELPSSGSGRVLVTSRHRSGYDAFGKELTIDVLDVESATRYLLSRSQRTSEAKNAAVVATALGCLPLALAHAGAYCEFGIGVPFGEYLELLEGLPSQELFDNNPEVFYQLTIAATWNASITAAERQAPLARRVLEMAAFLAPEGIPRSFFSVLEDNSLAGRKRIADALAALHRYSLATVRNNQVSVHRLLQKVIRDRLTGNEKAEAAVRSLAAIQAAMPSDPQMPATWPRWQELLPHAIALTNTGAAANLSAIRFLNILNLMCRFLLSSGSPLSAQDLATRTVSVSGNHVAPDHSQALAARGNLAASFEAAGQIDEAIAIMEQLVTDYERISTNPDSFMARGNLAFLYKRAGRVNEAIAILESLVSDTKLIPDSNNLQITLPIWVNLANTYESVGRVDDALAILRPLAADTERILGPDHLYTPLVLGSLAALYRAAGRDDEAIIVGERTITDFERLLGPRCPEHPDYQATLEGLASSYQSSGRIGDAIAILERIAAHRDRLLGPEHLDTLAILGKLAFLYYVAGRPGEALIIEQQVATHRERLQGPHHPDTLTAWGNLADSYQAVGRTSEAIAIGERVVTNFEQIISADNITTLRAKGNLARSYQSAGRPGDAIAILERLVPEYERIVGRDNPETLAARRNLGNSYRLVRRLNDAIAILEQLVIDCERVIGRDNPDTLIVQAYLADSYMLAGRPREAIAILERLVPEYERILGPDDPHVLGARTILSIARTNTQEGE